MVAEEGQCPNSAATWGKAACPKKTGRSQQTAFVLDLRLEKREGVRGARVEGFIPASQCVYLGKRKGDELRFSEEGGESHTGVAMVVFSSVSSVCFRCNRACRCSYQEMVPSDGNTATIYGEEAGKYVPMFCHNLS